MTGYKKVFLDTAPLIYFLDADEHFGETVRKILRIFYNLINRCSHPLLLVKSTWYIHIKRAMKKKWQHLGSLFLNAVFLYAQLM